MSPRPIKPRRCSCPFREKGDLVFKPAGRPMRMLGQVVLERDELEAVVLCDRDGLTQEQAGESMGVSRGTVQRLVAGARRKIAGALAGERALVVRGGDRGGTVGAASDEQGTQNPPPHSSEGPGSPAAQAGSASTDAANRVKPDEARRTGLPGA